MPPRRRRVDDDGPREVGRPSILSPAFKKQRERFLRSIKSGNSVKDAAAAASLPLTSIKVHCRRGRAARRMERELADMPRGKARDQVAATLKQEQPCLAFLDAIEQAKAESKAGLVERWHAASKTDWRAAQAMLRARYPQEWAPDLMIRLLIAKLEENGATNLPGVHVRREAADLGAIPAPGLLPSTGLPQLPPGVTPRRAGDEGL